jgi:hypothetical protein
MIESAYFRNVFKNLRRQHLVEKAAARSNASASWTRPAQLMDLTRPAVRAGFAAASEGV